jgi:hypothetical protein
MANLKESLTTLLTIDGALCAALVDANSGMMLGSAGQGLDLDVAAAGNTEVVRAKMKTMKSLNLRDEIEDILITLGKQYHVIRPITKSPGLFFYLVLDKGGARPATPRRRCNCSARASSPAKGLQRIGDLKALQRSGIPPVRSFRRQSNL